MITASFKQEIIKELDLLPLEEQKKVLDFTRFLLMNREQGVPGRDLLCFAGKIDKSDLKLMEQAIETGCETVNLNEW